MATLSRLDLRSILFLDAVASGAMALLLLAGVGVLDSLFDLSTTFLRGVGVLLVPWVAMLLLVATRKVIPAGAVWGIVALNLLWVVGSVVLLLGDWVEPNALGVAFVIVQAIAVALITACQVECLARDGRDSGIARA